MPKFFRRLFCINRAEEFENENDDTLIPGKIPALDKLVELETTIHSKLASLELKLDQKLEKNLQSTSAVVEKVPISIELLNNKLDLLQKKLQKVEEKVDRTLEIVEKQSVFDEKNVDEKVGNIQNVGGKKKNDPLENVTVCATWKEQRYLSKTYKNLYPIDHPSLQNIEVKRDGDKLTYLMMSIAVRASNYAAILLSPVHNPGHDDYVFEIVLGERDVKLSHTTKPGWGNDKYVLERNTDVLKENARTFALFYLKVENGTIYFWSNNPRYTGRYRNYFEKEDSKLASIKYFGFNLFPTNEHMFLFDCKPSFEGAVFPVHG